jgi:hypothetical protein
MDCITVNGVEYRPVEKRGTLSIVIVDNRGLTFVGEVEFETQMNGMTLIRNARCVIRWGTSQHLAQLAESGPMNDTVLGASRDVYVADVIALYECSEKWQ